MRVEVLQFILCLHCQYNQFSVAITQQDTEHIIEGTLTCQKCQQTYPVKRGIPRFIPAELSNRVKHNVSNFGEQWKLYARQQPQNKIEFESYFEQSGLTPEASFKNRVILDAGCGSGKFAAISGQYPGVQLVGMDLSESVEVAFQATRHLAGTHIIQADILNAPLKPEVFDWVYSIGVLHHTQDPPGSFKSLSHFLKPGGFFFFWLYAKEGNGLYLTLFDPVRVHLTSHLPVWVNNIAAWVIAYISWPLVVTYACLQGVPFLHRWAIAYLPLYQYLLYFYTVGFWLWRNTILDKMIPEIAYHFSKAELLTWLDGFSLQSITFRNGNSWGVLIRKTGMPTKGLL